MDYGDEFQNVRDVVNGAQLPRFIGKPISIIGLVIDVASNGLTFNLKSVDNVNIPITLRKPLDKPLEGYVEVHGVSQGKAIAANDLVVFDNKEFDVKSHNELCNLLYTVPNLWAIN